MTYLLLGVLALFVFLLFWRGYLERRCAASEQGWGKGPHDWLYFGAAQGVNPFEKYWDRQCQRCGKYD